MTEQTLQQEIGLQIHEYNNEAVPVKNLSLAFHPENNSREAEGSLYLLVQSKASQTRPVRGKQARHRDELVTHLLSIDSHKLLDVAKEIVRLLDPSFENHLVTRLRAIEKKIPEKE